MGYIEGQDRYQVILFPESIDDYIGENSSVRIIDEFVEQLDLEVLGFKRCTCSATGRPPCDKEEVCDRKPNTEEIKKRLQELKQRKERYEGYKERIETGETSEISTVDPDARLMCNNNNNVDMGYNVQTTVDSKHKLIIDFKVTQNSNDLGELDNMALRAQKIFEDKQSGQIDTKLEVVADKGYYKVEDLKKCVKNGITPYVAKQTYSNGTGDKDFYTDRFRYDKELDVYICPAGQSLSFYRNRRSAGKTIGRDYRNKEACKECVFKDRCTKSEMGRSIYRHVDQDFLDTIDLQTELNREKYKQRQMIVEHPFGTVKRSWGAYFFLTRRKISVATEISITYLSYNLKRVINILGNAELLRRLRERRKLALG